MKDGRSDLSFELGFWALTGYKPFGWQRRLFELFVANDAPAACNIPTGLGKTSVIPIWLLALAFQVLARQVSLPRRLAYIVNRRTVVDQATATVQALVERLDHPGDERWSDAEGYLQELRGALATLASEKDRVIGVSTLRGELADNNEWKLDPARASIIVGTIDMIGSKLLFRGYGDSAYWRPWHAGIIGQDTLIVHDEAHLTPPFAQLLKAIQQAQSHDFRPIRTLQMSATLPPAAEQALSLTDEEARDPEVLLRLRAVKKLYLHDFDKKQLKRRIVDLCVQGGNGNEKVLVYVWSPEQALAIAKDLRTKLPSGAQNRIALLTGELRGFERDRFIKESDVFAAFANPGAPSDGSVYLVSTAAGEVGIDMDADRMVCDLAPMDSMIQRLGRVNRRGGDGRSARIDVVCETPVSEDSEWGKARVATRRILQGVQDGGGDVSPAALLRLRQNLSESVWRDAMTPSVAAIPATEVLLDAWSLTSVDDMVGRPDVTGFLHGLSGDPPSTYVAWRTEVLLLRRADVDDRTLTTWFRACPILTRERLRERTDRLGEVLGKILERDTTMGGAGDWPIVVLSEAGKASWSSLKTLLRDRQGMAAARFKTLILPVEMGGLSPDGFLDPTADPGANARLDVADGEDVGRERRIVRETPDGTEIASVLVQGDRPISAHLEEEERICLTAAEDLNAAAESTYLVIAISRDEGAVENPEKSVGEQTLYDHQQWVAATARDICRRLDLDDELSNAIILACRHHDEGKSRPVWQQYARNAGAAPVAKSPRYRHWRTLTGFRHEFGSIFDTSEHPDLADNDEQDLILHLIASHHGWARPHFPERAWDKTRTTDENLSVSLSVMRRFERLQRRFGRWGLAWLEAIVKSADARVSAYGNAMLPTASWRNVCDRK
jgi:CRISPR-associated endonuclease/helicase Cas3